MPTLRSLPLLLALTVSAAHAAPIPDRVAQPAACEPFTDPRELRFRTPAATVSGHIVAGTVDEPDAEIPEFGQTLVFGRADLASDAGDGKRVRISYAYWRTTGGCAGWEPARGQRYTFDLADDAAKDGALRVMRFLREAGVRP